MEKITATVPAYITNQWTTLDSLAKDSPERAVSDLGLWKPIGDSNAPEGWVKVGSAEVTVTFDHHADIVGSQIAMLRAAKNKVQADAELALNQIEGKIQNLLCIEAK